MKKEILDYKNEFVCKVFMRDNNFTKSETDLIFSELMKYLYLTHLDDEKVLGMYPYFHVLDIMWHTFILCTSDYEKFCIKYFGYFIHHQPNISEKSKNYEDEIKNEEIKYRKMLNLIYDNFGEETINLWFNHFPKKYPKFETKKKYESLG